MATNDRTTVEKTGEVPLSPVGSDSEKPGQETIENAVLGLSDEESQQHEFKVSKPSSPGPKH